MAVNTKPQVAGAGEEMGGLERVMIGGDLSQLRPLERLQYYQALCKSLGLNPLTRPFEYITLNGKLTLYARRDCTDQLRGRQGISIEISSRTFNGAIYAVTARASTPEGRKDESIGAVDTNGLAGDALSNAMMKAETKAKRRVTLSICGLGWTDESEVESIPGALVSDAELLTQRGQQPEALAESGRRRFFAIGREQLAAGKVTTDLFDPTDQGKKYRRELLKRFLERDVADADELSGEDWQRAAYELMAL